MKHKLIYLLFFMIPCFSKAQQELNFDLQAAAIRAFGKNFFVYGLRETPEGTTLRVYKLDDKFQVKDSMIQLLPKMQVSEILRLSSDTLHQQLSIHIQKKGETKLRIFRSKGTAQEASLIEQVEVQRLNNASMFRSEPYYFKDQAYAIRQTSDSGVKQFFLDRYSLLSDKQNYDYKPDWQWAFEKKDMEAARVIFADRRFVYLFAWRSDQSTSGQWLLKIDGKNGVLKHAVKLNTKSEDAYYQFGACSQEPGKNFFLMGQKFTKNKDGRPACDNKDPVVYLFEIDSLSEVISREQFTVALPKVPGVQKCQSILLRFSSFVTQQPSGIRGEIDIFRKEAASPCFGFNNTFTFSIVKNDDQYEFKTSTLTNQPALTGIVNFGDKLDLNGKICPSEESHSMFTAPLLMPVKIKFGTDSLKNHMWLLSKTDVRKKSKQFSVLKVIKNSYQLQPLENYKLEQNPDLGVLPGQKFFISHDTPEGKLQIKVYNW